MIGFTSFPLEEHRQEAFYFVKRMDFIEEKSIFIVLLEIITQKFFFVPHSGLEKTSNQRSITICVDRLLRNTQVEGLKKYGTFSCFFKYLLSLMA